MRIKLTSVFVDDQDKALRFYADVLGFVKKNDVPAGQFRWLTVVSPEDPEGVELVLEPNESPAAKVGVTFTTQPTKSEWGTDAVLGDTCGNLIGLHQD